MNMERYYAQLVGFKIVNFKFDQDEDADEDSYGGGSPFPVFTLERDDGVRVILSLSSDEEGNGGGFAFIEEAA
jgi:hypothetical protein|tara:strand:- start:228 stop:446 length:219 start_codon:yes stop_codon:yes gene_type:complete